MTKEQKPVPERQPPTPRDGEFGSDPSKETTITDTLRPARPSRPDKGGGNDGKS